MDVDTKVFSMSVNELWFVKGFNDLEKEKRDYWKRLAYREMGDKLKIWEYGEQEHERLITICAASFWGEAVKRVRHRQETHARLEMLAACWPEEFATPGPEEEPKK